MNIIKTTRKDCKNFIEVDEKDLVCCFIELASLSNKLINPAGRGSYFYWIYDKSKNSLQLLHLNFLSKISWRYNLIFFWQCGHLILLGKLDKCL